MKLYHGSDILIEKIDLEKSKPFKDFGKGFYLSAEYDQAMDMAKQRIRQKQGIGTPTVTAFDFDESIMKGEELKYDKGITFQYFFANEKAIAKLSRICDLNLNK